MPLPAAEPTTLAGKTCLVTGGAGGLGKAIVTAFLKAGANVIMCDINQERLKETSTELAGAGSLTAVRADITNPAEVEDLFTEIAGKFPTLDVLVNNAAIMDRFDPVAELDLELWDKVLSVNLTAPFMMTKLALRAMLQQPNSNGCIINIASGSAKAGWLAGTAYTASKHGLIGLTKSTSSFYGAKGRLQC
ncbi:Short chain dehydrogenase/reductase family oxidoreductase [Lasiodiplodia theobromae]|uniref:Short chain dehydrogenase/reductase family oxidoreductase n=1 Tax=Lasiodiplodia theobromae TaxID=45133 RepID=UPI0015C30A4A|nr:Short chain dehydrogenase/reductase family oxidoreductase [Lasiodiplodia theobromae]KAF4537760.1 Short chain dehydrogenase/reductase family oxidoreductase [Lasiodiplodia theobromae]